MTSIFPSLTEPIGRFFAWWGAELGAFVPKRSTAVSRGRRLVLSQDVDGPRLYLERGTKRTELTRATNAQERAFEIETLLAAHKRQEPGVPVVLRLPARLGLERTIQIPASAIGDARAIATLDLERATPFRRPDVLAAHEMLASETAAGKVRLRQIVFKRDMVREAQAPLVRHGLEPNRIECWDERTQAPLSMDFLDWDRIEAPPQRTVLPKLLLASAAALALFGANAAISRYETAEAEVRAEVDRHRKSIAATGAAKAEVQASEQRIAQLIAWRNGLSSRAELIETLTRLLPDTDYLTALNVEGREIELSGYSASTARLVPLIERSGAFTGTTLAAPAVLDQRTGKERFTIKTRVGADGAAAKGRSGQGG